MLIQFSSLKVDAEARVNGVDEKRDRAVNAREKMADWGFMPGGVPKQ